MPIQTPSALAGRLAGRTFSSLGVADYRRVFFGNMAFQFNVWMQQLTFGWLLLLIGDSPFWLGLNGFVSGAAMIVMGPIGGALAGSLLLARLPAPSHKGQILRVAALLSGLLVMVLGQAPAVLAAAPVLALIGVTSSAITALGLQTVQEHVSEELSGRVFGVYMLTMALMPLGSLPAGALAAEVGTAAAISLWGALGSLVIGATLVAPLVAARRSNLEVAAPPVRT